MKKFKFRFGECEDLKIIKFVYSIFSGCLTAAVIAVTLLALLLGISGMDRQNPKSVFGFRAFIVLTPSMVPEFDAGSIIIIKETETEELNVGDIITYIPIKDDDVLLTHRIVKINGDAENRTFITRGDANNTDDPNAVEPDSILGKTVFHMNGLGTFIVNLRTPPGIAAMVGVIAVGLFIIPYLLTPREVHKKKAVKNIIDEEDEDGIPEDLATDSNERSDDDKSDITED